MFVQIQVVENIYLCIRSQKSDSHLSDIICILKKYYDCRTPCQMWISNNEDVDLFVEQSVGPILCSRKKMQFVRLGL